MEDIPVYSYAGKNTFLKFLLSKAGLPELKISF